MVITTIGVGVNVTNLLLNVTGTNKPSLTNNNAPDAHDSNDSNWVKLFVATLSVATFTAVAGMSFWYCKKRKTSNKKREVASNCKTLTIPLMFKESPISAQKEENIPDAKCSVDHQFRV